MPSLRIDTATVWTTSSPVTIKVCHGRRRGAEILGKRREDTPVALLLTNGDAEDADACDTCMGPVLAGQLHPTGSQGA